MGNCFVTKLKSVVNNDNLVTPTELKIAVKKLNISNGEKQQKITFHFADTTTIKVTGSGAYAYSLADLETNPQTADLTVAGYTNVTLYFKNDDYNIIIDSKFNLINLVMNTEVTTIFNVALADIKYLSEVNYFQCGEGNARGDISGFINKPISQICVYGNGISGDISSIPANAAYNWIIAENKNITGDVNVFANKTPNNINFSNTSVYGNIADLVGVINNLYLLNTNISGNVSSFSLASSFTLGQLNINGTQVTGDIASFDKFTSLRALVLPTGVSGTIESLADGLLSNGKSSGTLTVNGTNITYNGIKRGTYIITFSSGSYVVN